MIGPARAATLTAALAPVAALLGASAWFQPEVGGSDLWWHLAAGREIWAQGAVARTDPYSWTYAGRPWMNVEWLWSAIAWRAYRVAPDALAWANLAVLFAVFGLAYARARRACGSRFAAGAALWLVAASAHWFLDVRPHLTTLLLLGVFLLTRERAYAPWLWPPLVLLWVNLHGGFAFGVAVIGLHVGIETLRACARARRAAIPWRLWLGLIAAATAVLGNPWGIRILEFPLAYLDAGSPWRELIEWRAPAFALGWDRYEGRFWGLALLAGMGAALGAPGLREALARRGLPRPPAADPFAVCLAGVCFAMAVTSRRFIPLFGIASVALVACALRWGRDLLAARAPRLRHPAAGLATALGALLLGGWLWRDVRLHPDLLARWTGEERYPEAGLRYLAALAPGPRLLSHYNWGGYVMLHAPQFRVWIDGRANTLYGDEIYRDYRQMLIAAPGLPERLARYPADAALLPTHVGGLARALAQPPLDWELVYLDPVCAILLPPGSPRLREPLPDPEPLLGDHPDYRLQRALARRAESDAEGALRDVRAALAREPRALRAWRILFELLATSGQVDRIGAEAERAIRAQPRRRFRLRLLEAGAYESAGAHARALAAYREALPGGPFTDRTPVLDRIARLERRTSR